MNSQSGRSGGIRTGRAPGADEKAEPAKIEGTQAVGAVAAGASASTDESVHLVMTSKKAPGTPVVVTELYDLGAEENASEFVVKMYPFDPTHSRPIALGCLLRLSGRHWANGERILHQNRWF